MASDPRQLCQQLKALIDDAQLPSNLLSGAVSSNRSNQDLTRQYLVTWNQIADAIERGRKQDAYMNMGALLGLWMELQNRLPEAQENER